MILLELPFMDTLLSLFIVPINEKYLISIIIGKIFLVYFWGFIGTGLIESIQNPKILIKIAIYLVISFVISKIINRKFKIE